MPGVILTVDGNDQKHFSLQIDGPTLTIGHMPDRVEALMQGVRIRRIRCEIELDDESVFVSNLANKDVEAALDEELLPGATMRVGHAHLQVDSVQPPVRHASVAAHGPLVEKTAPLDADTTTPSRSTTQLGQRFLVIDGPDQGKSFPVPSTGPVSIGSSPLHAAIVLNDPHVSRVHCELQIDGNRLVIAHMVGKNGTLVNGAKILAPRELQLGDVVRIGSSNLKFEIGAIAMKADIPEAKAAVGKPAMPTAAPRSPVDQLIHWENERFSSFQLGERLGRDHVAMVFRATDTKTNQTVAVKVLAADLLTTQPQVDHFAQTMRVAARLQHPNLVELIGGGRSGRYCWIAREFIEGESVAGVIDRSLKEGPPRWNKAAHVALDVARALAFLEQNKVVHQGITPSNLMIRAADGVTKVADVMLADGLKGIVALDQKGPGVLRYHAPEQLGSGEPVDHRADLFSLGAVVYHLLTGNAPFIGESAAQILDQIQKGKLVKPTKLQSTIPPRFEAVVMRLLAYFPKDRYQSAAELLADLGPIAQNKTLTQS